MYIGMDSINILTRMQQQRFNEEIKHTFKKHRLMRYDQMKTMYECTERNYFATCHPSRDQRHLIFILPVDNTFHQGSSDCSKQIRRKRVVPINTRYNSFNIQWEIIMVLVTTKRN